MMNCCVGARNVAGFTASLKQGLLPPETHLTYEGLFNEIKYNVGPKTDKVLDLHYGYSRFQFMKSQFDSNINDYLALFLKGKSDGEEREDDVNLNLVVCLDISGSMGCNLGNQFVYGTNQQTRLALSIEAIKMLIGKLKPNDSIGMVVFDDRANTVFESTLKKNLTSEIFERLNKISTRGGTTIINGFTYSNQMLKNWIQKHPPNQKTQNRIIMLTDVCDNSISHHKNFIEETANINNIHTSIIGISTEFQSQSCQVFKEIKGFNYFCAVNQEDIKKYVFQTFDFGFFPSASNVVMNLESEEITEIEVFGTPDSDKIAEYKTNQTSSSNWPISKIKSCFPSEIEMIGDTVYTVGGLILIKLKRNNKGSSFNAKLHLQYDDPDGKTFNQVYPIKFEFHPEEQFFSGDELREAIEGFVFTSEMKKILKESSKLQGKEIYEKYWDMLMNLKDLCPKQKLKEFDDIKKILEKYSKEEKKQVETLEPAKTMM